MKSPDSAIGIIDYGRGNLGSVFNACRFLGLSATFVTRPEEADRCRGLILPGVGAFGDCLAYLRQHGWTEFCRDWILRDRPFLGICIGLQALFEKSEESPDEPGIGVLSGRVRRFSGGPGLKVPQMGWNRVDVIQPDCPLFRKIPDGSFFYFVHSYYADPVEQDIIAGSTEYGRSYASAVWRKLCFAVQFHPEKSQDPGLRVLANFGAVVSASQGKCPCP